MLNAEVDNHAQAAAEVEHEAYAIFNPNAKSPLLLLCDHASAAIPTALERLGLAPERLAEHIAFDLGAEALARAMAASLDATLVATRFSRLLIDPNRPLGHPESIPLASHAVAVPGNEGLSAAEVDRRQRELFWPYHRATGRSLRALERSHARPAVVSVHSFTPTLDGTVRPWDVGVLHDGDAGLARPILAALREEPALRVGDNAPYDGRISMGYTIAAHAEARGHPNVLLEVRQDLIADGDGVARWAKRLTAVLGRAEVRALLEPARDARRA